MQRAQHAWMNVYEIYIAGREKTITVDGDRVEVTRDFLKVFKGTHEVGFFTGGRIDGCTVAHGQTTTTETKKMPDASTAVSGP